MDEQFDLIFKDFGGIDTFKDLTTKGLSGEIFKSFSTLDAWIKTKYTRIPTIYCNYINNSKLNACVRKSGNTYYIGIFFGTFYLLQDLFCRMLSCPKILSEYGDPSKETKPQPLFNAQITDLITLLNCKEEDVIINLPKDDQRLFFANFLTSVAMKFLFLHEYGHIANGHIDYKSSLYPGFSLEEISDSSKILTFNKLDSQTLEMDADCYAVCKGIIEILEFNKYNEKINESFIKDFFSDLNKCVYLWMFAVYSFFRIFGFVSKEFTKNNLLDFKHPPPGVRQHYVFSTLDAFFEKNQISIRANLPELSKKTILSVEKAFEEISEQGYDTRQIGFALDLDVFQHGMRILENWNNIRPSLQNFAYCELAPLHS